VGEAVYTSMLDAVSDGVVAFSPDRRIICRNQAFLDITGLDRSDLEQGLRAVIQGADTDPHTIVRIDEALADGTSFDDEIIEKKRKCSTIIAKIEAARFDRKPDQTRARGHATGP